MFALLPLIVPLAQVSIAAPSSDPAIAISRAVRARLAGGWHLAARDDDDDDRFWLTLARGAVAERHELTLEGGRVVGYRVVHGVSVPAGTHRDDSRLRDALAAPDAVLYVHFDCGEPAIDSYQVVRAASGPPAAALVASVLAEADDLEDLDAGGDLIVFWLSIDDAPYDLSVHTGARGRVEAAELRRLPWRDGWGHYRRLPALHRALVGRDVTAIDFDDGDIVLDLGDRRFVLDPDGRAFADDDRDDCGC